MDPSSSEVNIMVPDANQGNEYNTGDGVVGQAVEMSNSDWILIQNWFETDLSCTMPNCREMGIYNGRCHHCNHILLCIQHARMCSMNQYHCLRCQQPLIWSQLTAIISDRISTDEPTQKTSQAAKHDSRTFRHY